jgi:putative ABC transport system ATP-binding protein
MTVLEAIGLHRFFHTDTDEIVALKDVALRVDAGEFVAIVGPSGSGKSTLIACLAGLDEPDGGTVTIAGQRMSRRPEVIKAALRAAHIGLMYQGQNLFDHLTVHGNVRLAQRLARRPSRNDLERLGIAQRAHSRPGRLSGGEAARAAIAVATAADPGILLADEPTAELDTTNEAAVLNLLVGLTRRNTAAVVVTHSERVAGAADRVLHMSDGRLSDGR